jgi:hypothetical protein
MTWFSAMYRSNRNIFAHTYATPKISNAMYQNLLFVGRMKGEYEALRMDAVAAVGVFEEALRTQKVVEMEEERMDSGETGVA